MTNGWYFPINAMTKVELLRPIDEEWAKACAEQVHKYFYNIFKEVVEKDIDPKDLTSEQCVAIAFLSGCSFDIRDMQVEGMKITIRDKFSIRFDENHKYQVVKILETPVSERAT